MTASSVPLVAAPDIITPRVTPIIPRPDPTTVQPPRTVVHRQAPLADDGPVGRSSEVTARVAGRGEVFPPRSLVLGGGEDLVDVVVEGDVGGVGVVEDAVPVVAWSTGSETKPNVSNRDYRNKPPPLSICRSPRLTRLESIRIDDQQSALGIVPLTRPGVPGGVIGVDGELTGGSQVRGRGESGGFVQDRLEVQVKSR